MLFVLANRTCLYLTKDIALVKLDTKLYNRIQFLTIVSHKKRNLASRSFGILRERFLLFRKRKTAQTPFRAVGKKFEANCKKGRSALA